MFGKNYPTQACPCTFLHSLVLLRFIRVTAEIPDATWNACWSVFSEAFLHWLYIRTSLAPSPGLLQSFCPLIYFWICELRRGKRTWHLPGKSTQSHKTKPFICPLKTCETSAVYHAFCIFTVFSSPRVPEDSMVQVYQRLIAASARKASAASNLRYWDHCCGRIQGRRHHTLLLQCGLHALHILCSFQNYIETSRFYMFFTCFVQVW